jgi:hypothetical protein
MSITTLAQHPAADPHRRHRPPPQAEPAGHNGQRNTVVTCAFVGKEYTKSAQVQPRQRGIQLQTLIVATTFCLKLSLRDMKKHVSKSGTWVQEGAVARQAAGTSSPPPPGKAEN